MAITTLDGLIGATKTNVTWMKTGTRTTAAVNWFSTSGVAGSPIGTLAVGNTAAGIVPTDDGTESPSIPAGYISRIVYGSTVACSMHLYDRLFACGAYGFGADTTLANQPSFAGRIPSVSTGLELWYEAVTGHTTNTVIQVNYLDQDGNAGDTGQVAFGNAPILGRMQRIPLAAGDTGITQITRVRQTGATAGTFNISVMRPLWSGRVPVAGFTNAEDFLKTGLPQVYATSCLWVILQCDSTAVGLPYMQIQLAEG